MGRTERKIAAVVLVMVAASLALILQSMRIEGGVGRITSLRTWSLDGTAHAALFFNNELHLLDASGSRVARQPLADLSLTEEPNDMDWVTTADGSVQAWFFEDTTPRIVRCTFDAAAHRLGQCAQALAGPVLKANPRSRAVHLSVDAAGQRVFLADAKGHQVRALGFDGRLLATSAQGALYFPNRLRLAPGGQLIVADNDHRRLVWLDVAQAVPGLGLLRTLSATDHPQARAGKTKVTDLAFLPSDDGARPAALWMLAVAQGQQRGDVLVYGDGLVPRGRADLGRGTDPLAIDTLGSAALVADYDGVDLYRVGADGAFLGPFGEPALRAEFAAQRAAAIRATWWHRLGLGGLVLALVLGLVAALKLRDRFVASAGAAPAWADTMMDLPAGSELVLSPLPWFVRQQRIALWSGVLMVVGTVAAAVLLLLSHEVMPLLLSMPMRARLGVVTVLSMMLLLMLGLQLRGSLQLAGLALVLRSGEVEARANGKTLAAAPLGEVLAGPHTLLLGRFSLAYRRPGLAGPGRWVYDEEQLTRYLLARLGPAQRVTADGIQRALWRRASRWRRWAVGTAALLLAVELLRRLLFP